MKALGHINRILKILPGRISIEPFFLRIYAHYVNYLGKYEMFIDFYPCEREISGQKMLLTLFLPRTFLLCFENAWISLHFKKDLGKIKDS